MASETNNKRSATYQLVEIKLGRDPSEYLRGLRAAGKSWQMIAFDLYDATGQRVTTETLRAWGAEPRDLS
jgi:hypothetical protein